ncbi:MAG: N-acetylmuramoyl-L-alanine amidase [Planctomycetota bacterium]|nr:N-acetylmuramoyl-L-alanine amidase [Planctomycetota bacterium]
MENKNVSRGDRIGTLVAEAMAAILICAAGCEPRGGFSYVDEGPEAECESARPMPAETASRRSVADIMERIRRERAMEKAPVAPPGLPQPDPVRPVPKYRPPASPEAEWAASLKREWKYIVIHHSATETGSAAEFHRIHTARGWDGLGYDFVIGNGKGSGDGEIEVGYRWKQQLRGAHAGAAEYNEHGIGIVLVGNFNETRPTEHQMESLRHLLRFLMDYCGIPAHNVLGHNEIKITDCPGRNFDMKALRAAIAGYGPSSLHASDLSRGTRCPAAALRTAGRTSAAQHPGGTPASKTVRIGGGAMMP